MNQLSSMLSVALGFVTVMAGVSMLVSAIVGILHRIENRRRLELAEMLAAANFAFRVHHGDHCAPGDAPTAAFVKAILSDPVLLSADDLRKSVAARPNRPLEWITKENLNSIIERNSENGVLPSTWHYGLGAHQATAKVFERWLDRWFPTIEANATDRFRKHSQRVSMVVAAAVVVLLNLDAFQLTIDLFAQGSTAAAVEAHAVGLAKLADRFENRSEQDASAELAGDLLQINGVLNVPELRLGWQRSAFIERYCAFRETCARPAMLNKVLPQDDLLDFAIYMGRWLAGLLAGTILLWLGAPFWADRLRDTLRLRSAITQTVGLAQPKPPAQYEPQTRDKK